MDILTDGVASMFAGGSLDTATVKMKLFPNIYQGMLLCLLDTAQNQRNNGFFTSTVQKITSKYTNNHSAMTSDQKIVNKLTGYGSNTIKLNHMENAVAGYKVPVSKIECLSKIEYLIL